MNPEEALEQLRQKQAEMMRQAQEMEERATRLQMLSECFTRGFKWRFEFSIDETETRVGGLRLRCERSGAWCEFHYTDKPERNGVIHITVFNNDYTLQEFLNAHNSKEEEQ